MVFILSFSSLTKNNVFWKVGFVQSGSEVLRASDRDLNNGRILLRESAYVRKTIQQK